MSQVLNLKAKGLYTSWSEFAEVPDGALLVADDVNISSDNIVEPRRGFDRLAAAFSNSSYRASQFWFYQDKLFAHNGTDSAPSIVSYFNSGSWTTSDTKSVSTGFRMRYAEANQNLYYTTTAGVTRIDAFNATPVLSGTIKALDVSAATTGASGFITNGNTLAYRVVWGFRDQNENLIIGAPSARFELTNSSGGTRDASVTFTIPSGVTTSFIYQIYRSAQLVGTPNDELQLVYEGNPTSSEITAGTITVTDIVPDSLRGATIYTAPSQEGIAFANERPPLAKDITLFNGVMFYANTVSKHRYRITLLSVGGSSGMALNDTVRFGGITYTAKAAETIASAEFLLTTGGTASENIRDTALSLVRVINRHASSTVYAYYLSGPNDLPGQILLEERSIGGSAFAIRASRPASWSPAGIPTAADTETSTNDTLPNGLAWSKPSQPEAVPLPNQQQVGTKSAAILRIVPLKDSLIIFKEDGIYRLTGFYPSFQIELMDSSAKLIGSETPAILNNQIFCLTDQGVVVVSDSVKIISRPIESTILDLVITSLSLVTAKAYGCSYEAERRYYLLLPSNSDDTLPTQMFVYNVFTQAWTRYTVSATAAIASTNEFYIGDADSAYVLKEKRDGTSTDYGDFKTSITVTIASATTLSVSSSAGLVVGDIVYQSASVFANILSVDSNNNLITVNGTNGFTNGTVTIYGAVGSVVKWLPAAAGNPGITKQWHTVQALFKKDFVGQGAITVSTDVSQSESEIQVTGNEYAPWGVFSWGNSPWGADPIRRPVRQWIPRDKQRSSLLIVGFKHSYAFSAWQLQGMSIHYVPGTEKTDR